jgi:hypothetical protein
MNREEIMARAARNNPGGRAKARTRSGGLVGSRASARTLLAALLLAAPGCTDYQVVVQVHDPARAHQGVTFVTNFDQQRITAIDMDGTVVWDMPVHDSEWVPGHANGFRIQDDGTVCYLLEGKPMLSRIEESSLLFEGPDVGGHHSIVMTPHDTFLVLAADTFVLNEPPFDRFPCVRGDQLFEVDLSGNIVWQWVLREHAPPLEYHDPDYVRNLDFEEGCHDWSHGNSVKFVKDYYYTVDGHLHDIVVFNAAGLHTFFVIDYDTGNVLYSCGEFGTLGRVEPGERPYFYPAHEVDYVRKEGPYDVFIMYDNGLWQRLRNSRAVQLKIDPVAGETILDWQWSKPLMYSWFGADADVLPNDNVLITNTTYGELIEVTRSGDVVWNARVLNFPLPIANWLYQSQRVPHDWLPWLSR